MLKTVLFDYELPEELIAQRPADRRDGSRMMVLDRRTGATEILPFPAITEFLSAGDALICNDTKVIRGRMFARRGGEPGGARFEILLVNELDAAEGRWKVLLRPGRRALPGVTATLLDGDGQLNLAGDGFTVLGRCGDEAFEVRFHGAPVEELQRRYGHVPLPPYIRRPDENADGERYQTIFAARPGAVAAPTAGLHFTPEVLAELAAKGVGRGTVTLHVGPGTFKPVTAEDASEHRMHAEEYTLPPETAELVNRTHAAGHQVLAVGTTSVRVLESCAAPDGTVSPGHGWTEIFLYPPYQPRAVDRLLTNFHLPKSTLLMLVSTFADREMVLAAYRRAVEAKMRFYSYGDCMLLI